MDARGLRAEIILSGKLMGKKNRGRLLRSVARDEPSSLKDFVHPLFPGGWNTAHKFNGQDWN